MSKSFWQDQLQIHEKLCFLAPMDGYGDSAYRQSMKRVAPHVYCISEFYSADGLIHSKFLADSVLPHQTIEDPLIIQIFGKDPEVFAKAAKIISDPKYNIAGIDVNMGCPAKKVVRSGHGSSLLINEQTAFDIVKALDEATHLPISVKTRLSFDGNQDLIAFAQGLQKSGAKLVTIHGRTAKQAYTGNADFTNIYELQKHVDIPVIGNGDVENYDDGMKKAQNLNGFMIGRRSFGNPWAFLGKKHFETDTWKDHVNGFKDGIYYPTLGEMLEAMDFHADKLVATKGEKKGSLEIRKHLVQYIKSFPGVKEYRKRLVTTESYSQTQETILELRQKFSADLLKRPGLGEIE
ncbi:tRNA-dihydrouridine synthase family protein [Candidatus Gracilibacteria bacterium]|nr:tRNA-dihydrouridine synthase family protein [Candidatus Gracilibacteria bacterium]